MYMFQWRAPGRPVERLHRAGRIRHFAPFDPVRRHQLLHKKAAREEPGGRDLFLYLPEVLYPRLRTQPLLRRHQQVRRQLRRLCVGADRMLPVSRRSGTRPVFDSGSGRAQLPAILPSRQAPYERRRLPPHRPRPGCFPGKRTLVCKFQKSTYICSPV